ncbi:MAG: GlgB N-terminal domain-containing protein, partial [Gammaproteobacteria bacterium]
MTQINQALQRILDARHHDPFEVLGLHTSGKQQTIRVFRPQCREIRLGEDGPQFQRLGATDLFEWTGTRETLPRYYRLSWIDSAGQPHSGYDPYNFGPQIADYDLYLFGEGRHWHIHRI